jgi:Flp pilus assembly protein TadD
MEHLKRLMSADYRFGYTNGHGADGTVRSLEYGLQHLEADDASTAESSAAHAASALESRLFAAYVLRSLAALQLGDRDKAHAEYKKAVALSELASQSYGNIPSLTNPALEETLAVVERRLRQSGVTL